MTPYYEASGITIYHGDCLDVLRTIPEASVDSIVTDPPYELGFMGKEWDGAGIAYSVDLWREALRVLKPGGHLLAFGGTRTYHRMTCAIEDAGFEIRDSLHWTYGSGFPKSLDVSKALDKMAGVEMESRGHIGYTAADERVTPGAFRTNEERANPGCRKPAPTTDAARQWSGWGTALKPSHEPVVVARKPLAGTVADNVLTWGTGAINVDGCRVESGGTHGSASSAGSGSGSRSGVYGQAVSIVSPPHPAGRWPANTLLTHDPNCTDDECEPGCPVRVIGEQSGERRSAGDYPTGATRCEAATTFAATQGQLHSDTGTAARFFPQFRYDADDLAPFLYCAKASRRERNAGCEELPTKTKRILGGGITSADHPGTASGGGDREAANHHPTVKPVALMQWLCRLVTPPGGTVLEPFGGSGTTAVAAIREGFRAIVIEREAEYIPIIEARVVAARASMEQERCVPAQLELF